MLTVEVSREPDRARIILTGELDLGADEDLRAAVAEALPAQRVEVDLADLAYCDSSGVNALIEARLKLREQGVPLYIVHPHGLVASVLRVCGVLTELSDPNL